MNPKVLIQQNAHKSPDDQAEPLAEMFLKMGFTEPAKGAMYKVLRLLIASQPEDLTTVKHGAERKLLQEIYDLAATSKTKHLLKDDTDMAVFLRLVGRSQLFDGVKGRNIAIALESNLKHWLVRAKKVLDTKP